MSWLIRTDVLVELRARMRASGTPNAEQLQRFVESNARGRGPSSVMNVAGDVAEIRVEGVLTPRPDFMMTLFGYANTAYPDILAALAQAASSPEIKKVSLYVDSPGGSVAGLFDVLAALEAFKKPIAVRAASACSAAFAIAAVAGPITATVPAAAFGSVGVAASIYVDDDVVEIASTAAPNKRPDVTTDAGKAVIRAELDEIHQLFVEAIARGRKTTAARVNADFGRGGVLLAGKALAAGMIDRAPSSPTTTNAGARAASPTVSTPGASRTEHKHMDIEVFKAQHPEVFAAVKKLGSDEAWDTVHAHITLAEGSGAMKTAIDDIKARKPVTVAVQSHHMSASMNRHAINARQAETDWASAAVSGAGTPSNEGAKDLGDLFAESLPRSSAQAAHAR